MAVAVLMRMWCVGCRAESDFEHPPCPDGHDGTCPELCCVSCGYAVLTPAA